MRREREEIKTRSERREKAKYKTLFRFTTSVHTIANLQRYEHKWYNFGTYATSDGSCFLCLVWDMCQIFSIWHISHIYYGCFKGFNLNETCLRRIVKKDFGNICTRKIYPTNLDQGARQARKHDQSTVNLQVISRKLSCQRNNKVQDEGKGSFLRK